MKRQKKKENSQNSIIKAAIEEFRHMGYRNASMRRIASKANMTVGNIYCYYKSKEDLFNKLIEGTYQQQKDILTEASNVIRQSREKRDVFLDAIIQKGSEILYQKRDIILILYQSSQGTKYQDTKTESINIVQNNYELIYNSFADEERQTMEINKDFILPLLSAAFIQGIITILENYETKHDIEQALETLAKFELFGLRGFFSEKQIWK